MDTLEIGTGRMRVCLTWQRWGKDLHVHIAGGRHHVGAVALVGWQPDGELYSGVLHLPPHKEGQLAGEAARSLHGALGGNICVTAGIHLDEITPAEVEGVLENVRAGVGLLARRLQTS